MDLPRLEQLVASSQLEPPTTWFAVDARVGPRGDAETSPARGVYHHPYRQSHGQPLVAGGNDSWLVQVALQCSSWPAPLRLRRIIPGEHLTLVAAEPIRSWLEQGKPPANAANGSIFTFDAGYDAVQLRRALMDLPVGLRVRLRAGRCFSADPTTPPHPGRPRRHGVKCAGDDPTTWSAPSATWSRPDPNYGPLWRRAWSGWPATPHRRTTTRHTPHAAHAAPGHSSVGRCSGSRSSVCHDPPKRRLRWGSGGRDPHSPSEPRWGGRILPGARWSTPAAASSRPCAGPRPHGAHPPLRTAGPGA